MNFKSYRIWKYLFNYPNEWVYLTDIAQEIDLTYRQVLSLTNMMPSPPIERDKDEETHSAKVMLKGDENALYEARKYVIFTYFKIGDEEVDKVCNALSSAGWTCVADLSEETGLSRQLVANILSITKEMDVKTVGSVSLYRRKNV